MAKIIECQDYDEFRAKCFKYELAHRIWMHKEPKILKTIGVPAMFWQALFSRPVPRLKIGGLLNPRLCMTRFHADTSNVPVWYSSCWNRTKIAKYVNLHDEKTRREIYDMNPVGRY